MGQNLLQKVDAYNHERNVKAKNAVVVGLGKVFVDSPELVEELVTGINLLDEKEKKALLNGLRYLCVPRSEKEEVVEEVAVA